MFNHEIEKSMAIHARLEVASQNHVTQAEIEAWLVSYIAELRGVGEDKISRTARLSKYGLDSVTAVTLSGDLIDWLKYDIEPTVLYQYPTIERAAEYLANLIRTAGDD